MKDFTEYINGTFDAKGFAESRIEYFEAAKKLLPSLKEIGFEKAEQLKQPLEEIITYLEGFKNKPTNSHELCNKLEDFQAKIDTWTNNLSEEEKGDFSEIGNTPLECKKNGPVSFKEVMTSATVTEQVFTEFLKIHGAPTSFEEPEKKKTTFEASDFQLFTDEDNEPSASNSGFSILNGNGEEKPEIEITDNKITVRDTHFSDKMIPMTQGQKLFPNGEPSLNDISQNFDGSCYMLASLRQMVKKDPESIKNLITENNDNTVTLHFFKLDKQNNKQPFDVVVDKTLPQIDSTCAPWVRLIEKGYAASGLKTGNLSATRKIETTSIANFDAGSFYESITSKIQNGLNVSDEIINEPDLNASKAKYVSILENAINNNALITITTRRHVMDFNEITKDNGKTVLHYHDQFAPSYAKEKSITLDKLFSNQSDIDTVTIIQNNPTSGQIDKITISNSHIVNEINKRNTTLTNENFTKIVSNEYREYLTAQNKISPSNGIDSFNDVNQFYKQLENNKDTDKLFNNAFTAFRSQHPNATIGTLTREMNSPAKKAQLLTPLFAQLNAEVEKKLLATNINRANNFKKVIGSNTIPDVLSNKAQPKPEEPKKEEPETETNKKADNNPTNGPSTDSIYRDLRALANNWKTERDRKKNSDEFNAMLDSLTDLCEAYEQKVSPERIKLLQERAYARCDYYTSLKKPHSNFGKMRVFNANETKKTLKNLNPNVEKDFNNPVPKETVALEVSTLLADRFINKHSDAFSKLATENESKKIDEALRQKLITQWSNNKIIMDFGEKFGNNTKQEFLDRLCQPDMQEILVKATEKYISAEKENTAEIKKNNKKLEKNFGVKENQINI